MNIDITRMIPNADPDFPFIEVHVSFYDEINEPHHSAEVTVFLEKRDSDRLLDIRDNAIEKARTFLSLAVQNHRT